MALDHTTWDVAACEILSYQVFSVSNPLKKIPHSFFARRTPLFVVGF